MIERAETFCEAAAGDILKVVIPNGAVVAAVNVFELKEWLSVGLILLTAAYTIWQWRRASRKDS